MRLWHSESSEFSSVDICAHNKVYIQCPQGVDLGMIQA